MTKQQEVLRTVGKFLKLQSMGYPVTAAECKQMSDLCFLSIPMKYRLSVREFEEMKRHGFEAKAPANDTTRTI